MKTPKEECNILTARRRTCRLCLNSNANEYVSIYEEQNNVTIVRIVIDCFGVKVRKNDGLTQDICGKCRNELLKFDKIRQRCMQSDKILRDLRRKKQSSETVAIKICTTPDEKLRPLPNKDVALSPTNLKDHVQLQEDSRRSAHHNYNHPVEAFLLPEQHLDTNEQEYEIQYLVESFDLSEPDVKDDRVPESYKQVHSNSQTVDVEQSEAPKPDSKVFAPDKKRQFICCGCSSYKFDNEDQLHVHREELHRKYRISDNSIRAFECDICYQRFLTEKLLNHHKERPYRQRSHVCKSCGLGYFTSCALRRHEKVCRIVGNNFSCEECGKRFRQIITLQNHQKLHHTEKAFSCPVCSKTFKKKFEISIHMVTHSSEQPYPCDHCSARFKRKQALKNHQRHHTNARPYKCHLCEEWFNSFAARKFHRQTVHEGLDPFRCEECGGSYGRRLRLAQHMRKVHGTDLKKL